jgi:oligoendopeptidase F
MTRKRAFSAILLTAALLGLAVGASAAYKERSQVPDQYKWNLADLFASTDAWRAKKAEVAGRLPELTAFNGKLGDSAATFTKALSTDMALRKEVVRLYVYAMQLRDEDTKVAANAALFQEAEQLQNAFNEASAFVQPEILAIDPAKIEGFFKAEPALAPYRPFVDNILRLKAHTRSPEVEKVLAQAGTMQATPDNVYGTFTGAEFPYPEITLSTGEKVRLDPSGFAKVRGSQVAEDRYLAFDKFFKTLSGYQGTVGTLLYGQVMQHVFTRDVLGYKTCVEAALDQNAIPVAVYDSLIASTHKSLPTLHRCLKLRQRMMGLQKLRYEDLYAPMVKSVEMSYTPEQAMDITLKAFAPLGAGYQATLNKGYESRWVDWFPTPGKRSGAYSEGAAYDVHPYQLLNFNGRYTDVSTLAHESGHSMHYFLSNHNQPYVTSEHAIFVAEVASTLNESLFFRYMLANAKDDDTRLFLLGSRLDSFRQTLFRQTLFAEFELKAHQMAERGDAVTGESMTKVYLDLLRQYYGSKEGVCAVDDYCGAEWEYIHHFFAYDFYVYQYATSLTASAAISKAILSEEAQKKPVYKTRDAYLQMLSSGCSLYPIELLKRVGVDMTTGAPFQAAMDEMNTIMDQMEAILAKKDAAKK